MSPKVQAKAQQLVNNLAASGLREHDQTVFEFKGRILTSFYFANSKGLVHGRYTLVDGKRLSGETYYLGANTPNLFREAWEKSGMGNRRLVANSGYLVAIPKIDPSAPSSVAALYAAAGRSSRGNLPH